MEVTIGGNRLGSGNKNKVFMREYERSSHDMSYIWRSTMAAGTLVPFLTEVALPGDTFDIDLDVDVLTHPTIGPLFGTYKIQLDVFQIPMRLYNGKLHMNMLGIGMDMKQIKLPTVSLAGPQINYEDPIDNQQINPSCIFAYLGIRGLGYSEAGEEVNRKFNAIPWLAYWDIYKNYYANKQEEIGAVIHKTWPSLELDSAALTHSTPPITVNIDPTPPLPNTDTEMRAGSILTIVVAAGLTNGVSAADFTIQFDGADIMPAIVPLDQVFQEISIQVTLGRIICRYPRAEYINKTIGWRLLSYEATRRTDPQEPEIVTFPLSEIDDLRKAILADVANPAAFNLNYLSPYLPFQYALSKNIGEETDYSILYGQEGLGLKTYNSDLFNNWIDTEWIDGVDGISAVTAVSTVGDNFTIDELNLSKKIYDMLNRIALSGGSYDDWLDAVYTHDRQKSAENPMYIGGLIRNLVFQEVVSNAASEDQPLGTLAGRGRIGSLNKGGKIIAKIDEPSYLMGIISITPNIDYSQGNKWDTNLETLDDLHKPALDEIGFQDLITDQMAWFDTSEAASVPTFKSAGKQPAWINYMTNVNVVRGNFADQSQQMFMVLNRRYEPAFSLDGEILNSSIKDLTTYIDPSKFNHIFADTRRDAQNFWAQIAIDMNARRKMSAKVIPNL